MGAVRGVEFESQGPPAFAQHLLPALSPATGYDRGRQEPAEVEPVGTDVAARGPPIEEGAVTSTARALHAVKNVGKVPRAAKAVFEIGPGVDDDFRGGTGERLALCQAVEDSASYVYSIGLLDKAKGHEICLDICLPTSYYLTDTGQASKWG